MDYNELRQSEQKMRDALLRLDLANKMREAIRDFHGMTIPEHEEVAEIVRQLRDDGFALAKKAVGSP